MNEPATAAAQGAILDTRATRASAWRVREATAEDVTRVAAGLAQLLTELGGSAPEPRRLQRATCAVIENPELGFVFVAAASEEIIGVIAGSWQYAIHVPGYYCLVQDLWVDRPWRGHGVGAELLAALIGRAHNYGVTRVEVGLPSKRFAGLAATRAFYAANGFSPLGPRMRLVIE